MGRSGCLLGESVPHVVGVGSVVSCGMDGHRGLLTIRAGGVGSAVYLRLRLLSVVALSLRCVSAGLHDVYAGESPLDRPLK